MRLGVYADLAYRRVDGHLSADLPFIRFVTAMAPRVAELVVFGRLDPTPEPHPYDLPPDGVRFVALPHYPRVTNVSGVVRSLRRAMSIFAAELERLDAVWVFGPHPVALAFAGVAIRRRTPLALGIRQDYPSYISRRLPSLVWAWAVPVAHGLEQAFRLLARRFPTVVVGEELARKYGAGRAPLLMTGFSLIRASDIVRFETALARSWDGPLRILSVGRVDPEKNPLLLPVVLAELQRREPRWRMTVAGEGQLLEAVKGRAAELGVADSIELLGNVPNAADLMALYRASQVFLHLSFTEGVPQVLFEAQAAGLPIVATDVGGVRGALAYGVGGLLIPPGDAPSAVAALERLRLDEGLRRSLIERGLDGVSQETIDVQLDRVADFLRTLLEVASRRSS